MGELDFSYNFGFIKGMLNALYVNSSINVGTYEDMESVLSQVEQHVKMLQTELMNSKISESMAVKALSDMQDDGR